MAAPSLEDRDRVFYEVEKIGPAGPALPPSRGGLSLRVLARALVGMQKEALVVSSSHDRIWRLASDEGPYLAGTDLAPPPLGLFCTGMVAASANEILRLASERGIDLRGLRLVQDTFYSMEGSALRGTMIGGALGPQLVVEADCTLGDDELRLLAAEAVAASPVSGLVRGVHESVFTLRHNGEQVDTGRVCGLPGPTAADPSAAFDRLAAAPAGEALLRKVREADRVDGEGGAGSSLQAEQSRTLNVRAICTIRDDGVKVIDQLLFRPVGSQFQMLSDEGGRAPDAFSYLAAGLAFCFLTQLGRYATITKRRLEGYRVVQDTHLSTTGGSADPVETHVFLDTAEDEDAARQMLDMAEQTCFLHALCRTDIDSQVQAVGTG